MGRTPRVERCLVASHPPVDRNLLHPWAKQQKPLRPWPWKIKAGCSKHWGVRKCWSNFHSCVQSHFYLLQRSGSGTRNWPKGAGNMSDWAVSFVCFLSFLFLKHISASKNSNWIPGLVSRLHDSHVWSQVELLWDMAWFLSNAACKFGSSAGTYCRWSAPTFHLGHQQQYDQRQDREIEIWSKVYWGHNAVWLCHQRHTL